MARAAIASAYQFPVLIQLEVIPIFPAFIAPVVIFSVIAAIHQKLVKIIEHELDLIDFLSRMVMAAVPLFIVKFFFNFAKPAFGRFIHHALVEAGQKHFNRLIPQRSRMGQDNIYIPMELFQFFLHPALDFIRWLFIRPPTISIQQPVRLVHAVCATDYKSPLPSDFIQFSILGK